MALQIRNLSLFLNLFKKIHSFLSAHDEYYTRYEER